MPCGAARRRARDWRVFWYTAPLGLVGPVVIELQGALFGRAFWAYAGWRWVVYSLALRLWPTSLFLLAHTQEPEFSSRGLVLIAGSVAANVVVYGIAGIMAWRVVAALRIRLGRRAR